MEDCNRALFNSPIPQCHTPLKRLGLSRKRKSKDFQSDFSCKIQSIGEVLPVSIIQIDEKIQRKTEEKLVGSEKINSKSEKETVENSDENVDHEKEVCEIQKRIESKEVLLRTLEKTTSKVVELESLIEVWKAGCKNAYFHLARLIEERQNENFNRQNWLKNLGIWEVMVENFKEDSEITFSDGSQ